jgi:hypothetical protein
MKSSIVAVIIATACCSHPKGPAMSKSECALAIEGFVSQDPARLRALPAACTLEDAQQVLQATKAQTPTFLGTSTEQVRLYFFKSETFKSVRVWVNKDGHVILIDAEYPPATPEQYFQVLGEPDAHLDMPWGTSDIPGGEHVWLQRGATIVSKPDYTKGVVHVGIFPAGLTLAEYEASHRYTKITDEDEG